jgi:DNA-binding NarL/FixJ family response regulator
LTQYISIEDRCRAKGRLASDPRPRRLDGVQATRLIKDEFLEVSVLVLTEFDNDSNVIDAIQAGAGGYIFLNDLTPETLLQSIHRVVEGGAQIKTVLLRRAVDDLIQNGRKTLAERTAEAARLTPREVDVLRLMGNGDANKVIASTLGITLDTAKKHVRNVIDKLQARTRTHAAIIAAQVGIMGNPITTIGEDQSELGSVA